MELELLRACDPVHDVADFVCTAQRLHVAMVSESLRDAAVDGVLSPKVLAVLSTVAYQATLPLYREEIATLLENMVSDHVVAHALQRGIVVARAARLFKHPCVPPCLPASVAPWNDVCASMQLWMEGML